MTLTVVQPLGVTDATLTSSTVPENDYAVWNAGTAYSIGNRVIRTSTHRIYERVVAGTTATPPENDSVNWLNVAPTNRWAMFDTVNSTATTQASSIVVEITPNAVFNSVSLLNIVASSVRVEVIDTVSVTTIYDQTFNMFNNGKVTSWYAYFYEPVVQKTNLIVTDLPSIGTAKLKITISVASGNASCGTCIFGLQRFFGNGIELGASVGIQDYSRKERDAFGNFILVPRSFAKRGKFQMEIENTQIDAFQDFMASIRTTPVLWIGYAPYTCTAIYGFYKDFDVVIAYHNSSDCNLEIEGLT
jgi:hypothetical protein